MSSTDKSSDLRRIYSKGKTRRSASTTLAPLPAISISRILVVPLVYLQFAVHKIRDISAMPRGGGGYTGVVRQRNVSQMAGGELQETDDGGHEWPRALSGDRHKLSCSAGSPSVPARASGRVASDRRQKASRGLSYQQTKQCEFGHCSRSIIYEYITAGRPVSE
jgi:hypothetical protein